MTTRGRMSTHAPAGRLTLLIAAARRLYALRDAGAVTLALLGVIAAYVAVFAVFALSMLGWSFKLDPGIDTTSLVLGRSIAEQQVVYVERQPAGAANAVSPGQVPARR